MRSVGSHSTSRKEKEEKKERRGRIGTMESFISEHIHSHDYILLNHKTKQWFPVIWSIVLARLIIKWQADLAGIVDLSSQILPPPRIPKRILNLLQNPITVKTTSKFKVTFTSNSYCYSTNSCPAKYVYSSLWNNISFLVPSGVNVLV